jgi:hypothetical protein
MIERRVSTMSEFQSLIGSARSMNLMKCLRFSEFGPPSVLRVEEVAIPEPGEGDPPQGLVSHVRRFTRDSSGPLVQS